MKMFLYSNILSSHKIFKFSYIKLSGVFSFCKDTAQYRHLQCFYELLRLASSTFKSNFSITENIHRLIFTFNSYKLNFHLLKFIKGLKMKQH